MKQRNTDMKKKDRIQILIGLIIVLIGFVYVSQKEAEYNKRLEEAEVCKLIYLDGQEILLPIE